MAYEEFSVSGSGFDIGCGPHVTNSFGIIGRGARVDGMR